MKKRYTAPQLEQIVLHGETLLGGSQVSVYNTGEPTHLTH